MATKKEPTGTSRNQQEPAEGTSESEWADIVAEQCEEEEEGAVTGWISRLGRWTYETGPHVELIAHDNVADAIACVAAFREANRPRPVDDLDPDAFAAALDEWRFTLAVDYQAPADYPTDESQFRLDAQEFGWRFTAAGELIENANDEEEPA